MNLKNIFSKNSLGLAMVFWWLFTITSFVSAQSDPFNDLVNELLGPDSSSVWGWFNSNVSSNWGFNKENIDKNDIEIKQFSDDKLIFSLPVFEKNGKVISNYAITVLPTKNIEDLFSDDNFYDNIDKYEEKTVSPTISDGIMTFALTVADTNDTMYLTIYPLDGDEKGQWIENFDINENDNPNSTDNLTDQLADCLDETCEDAISGLSCNVNESTLKATLTWRDLWKSDQLEISWKKHTDNNFVVHGEVDSNNGSYSVTLPQKTSYLFLIRPIDNNWAKDGKEITYLCKFSTDDIKQPAACVWDDCILNNMNPGPESALLWVLLITAWLFISRRLLRKN